MSGSLRRRFVVMSLPRCGSTTVVRLLNMHPEIRCLIEPFHPKRYEGRFHQLVTGAGLDAALQCIWGRWNGIKHVCEPSGWPFTHQPSLNDALIAAPDRPVIFMVRRNLLRRAVSHVISQRLNFWIGTRAEFRQRLDGVQFPRLDAAKLRRQMQCDRQAIAHYTSRLAESGVRHTIVCHETLFRPDATSEDRWHMTNELLSLLEFDHISLSTFEASWRTHFDPDVYQWATADVYRRIPGIDAIDAEVGSDDTGWLFRESS